MPMFPPGVSYFLLCSLLLTTKSPQNPLPTTTVIIATTRSSMEYLMNKLLFILLIKENMYDVRKLSCVARWRSG